jgi:protein-S-isoprenylcysteine O-methyltransferase Ste14
MTAIHASVCLLAAGVYVVFALGVKTTFRRVGPLRSGLILLSVCATIAAILEVMALAQVRKFHAGAALLGTGLYLSALALYVWCAWIHRSTPLSLAFEPDEPQHLVTEGPYRWVRHPFYSAYLLSYVAGLVMSGDGRLFAVLAMMAAIYGFAARREEMKFGRSALALEYAR